MVSVRTNAHQIAALQVLAAANRDLAGAQDRISSGLRIATPKDNAAVYAIAQDERATIGAYQALDDARNRAQALLDVTQTALDSVSDVLARMKALAVAAVDPSASPQARAALAADFEAAKKQIDSIVRNAGFQGVNLLDSSQSNFLQYGPRALPPAQPAAAWGNPLQNSGEPRAGDPIDLHFGFSGLGPQTEMISGRVDYSLRYRDGGAWTVVPLATHNIPTSPAPAVGASLPAYDAQAAAVMPAIPATATEVQIFAEYVGVYPEPDGVEVRDILANGSPAGSDSAEGVPHLLASWRERDWSASAPQSTAGAGVERLVIDTPLDLPTEAGAVINSAFQATVLQPGIEDMEVDYTVRYQILDPVSGVWTTLASSAPQTVAQNPPPTEFPFSLAIPAAPAASAGFPAARLVAEVTVRHDGSALPAPDTDAAAGSAASTSNVQMSWSAPNSAQTFIRAWAGASQSRVQADVQVTSSVPAEDFRADVSYAVRWFDGAVWREVPFPPASSQSATGASGAPLDLQLDSLLPPMPAEAASAVRAEIVARVAVTHDPLGPTPVVENLDLTVATWDGIAFSTYTRAVELARADNTASLPRGLRQRETTTKIEVLDDVRGFNTPIREKDTTTGGLAGLFLQHASLDDLAAAENALGLVDRAQARLIRQAQYYATRARTFATMQAFEGRVSDELTVGVGNLVDADLAKEGARLESAKVRQALASQTLAIANNFPQIILSLFQRS